MSGFVVRWSTAKLVLDRLPDRRERILRLYEENEDVRHILDDLTLAIDTLAQLKAINERNDTIEVKEFNEIIENLQTELLQVIDDRSVDRRV